MQSIYSEFLDKKYLYFTPLAENHFAKKALAEMGGTFPPPPPRCNEKSAELFR